MADHGEDEHRRRSIRKASQSSYIISRNAKKELREKMKKVSEVLKKPELERTALDKVLVKKNPELVKASQKNARRYQALKERILEIEDESHLLVQKYKKLADLIKSSKNVVVYTGAGISTAASIPDYRGPNGVWTLLKKGQELSPQDLSDAEPTFTHMSLTKLFRVGKVKHIVSQNCDGLHIRSGFPRHAISEVHGNMYIECCYFCAPYKEFVRLFDVTERTGVHRHATLRCCRSCGGSLQDTIVHFGEKGKLKSPYRWKEAVRAAKRADLILCLGSSLKVLRKYSCLWCMDKKPQHRPKLVIVNLQWTPKDDVATLKINGRCDTVLMNVMSLLGYQVPEYKREKDPIFEMCTPLRASERKTTTKKILLPPSHQTLKDDNRSRNKIASKSAAPKRSTRLTNSAKRDLDCQVHLFSKSSSPLNPELYTNTLDEQLMEEHQISFYRESPSEDFTESSTFYYPVMVDLLQLQSRPTVSTNSLLCNSHADSSEDVSHFQCHDIVVPSGLVTCNVPQSFECQNQDIQIVTTDNASLSGQDANLDYQNQNAPDLVVVNLGKDHCICEWEQEKLGEVFTLSHENIADCEAVVCVHSWAVDKNMSEIFVTDPKHTLSKQTTNVFQKSSSSRTVHNLSYTLDNISSNHLSGDIIYTHKSAFQVNLRSNHQGETNNVSDNLLVFSTEPVLKQCPTSISGSKNLQNGDNILALKQNGTSFVTNTIKQHDHVALPTSQPALSQIKGVLLDHCYTLPETSTPGQEIELLQVNVSKPLILENSSVCTTEPLQLKSSQMSVHSSNSDLGNSVLEFSPYNKLVSKEKILNPAHIFSDQRQSCSIYASTDVPSCILNMDDMEIVYTQEIHPDLSLDCSDHHISSYTNVVEIPTVIFPWNSKLLVFPSDGAQFQSRDLQTFESDLLTDSCPLELQLDQPVNGTIYENICCCENRVNCFPSDAVDHSDLYTDSKVPEVLFEPNIHSLLYSNEHSFDTFKDNDNVLAASGKQSFPSLERVYRKPIDKICKYHFRNTFLALQRSEEVEETEKADVETCHKISKMPVMKKSNNKKVGRENVCRKMYKRKESLAAIPGWFGKGLIVRKKRK